MSVVIDANLLVVLALDRSRAPAVEERLRLARCGRHAPFAVTAAIRDRQRLTRAVGAGQLAESDVAGAWRAATAAPVTLHELKAGGAVVDVARRLGRKSAYDASYIVLAQELDAELWTLDGPLARNAQSLGLPVRLINTASS